MKHLFQVFWLKWKLAILPVLIKWGILGAGAVAVLDQYEKEDAEAAEREGLFEGLAARRQAMEQAMDKIIVVARADLKIRGLTAAGEQNNP